MPRFFFNVYDDLIAKDDKGLELHDLEAARAQAVPGARAMACEEVVRGRLNLAHWIEVTDDCGIVVATVSFREAVAIVNGES